MFLLFSCVLERFIFKENFFLTSYAACYVSYVHLGKYLN